jgi:hypothetical protein
MPVCKSCGNHFPTRLKVGHKWHSLHKRKRCLSCAPHKSGTRLRKVELGADCFCRYCGKNYKQHPTRNKSSTVCNSCRVNRRRFEVKKRAVEYKGGKCQRCDYSKSMRALEFHHRDPSQKDFRISGNHAYRWEKLQIELDKCELVCSNCHAEIHDELRAGDVIG